MCFAILQTEASSDGGRDNNDTRGSVSRGDSGHSDQSESSRSTLESSTNTPDTENQDLPATPDVWVMLSLLEVVHLASLCVLC